MNAGASGGIVVIGLTGQTGAGKSTASRYFQEHGFAVIDCDRVSREVSAPGSECLAALARAFSGGILHPDGSLDRAALGAAVFTDKGRLELLNRTIFPFITAELQRKVESLDRAGRPMVLLDAPTLFESGADRMCREILAVTADEATRLARIMERDGLSREAALHRIRSQLDEAFFRSHAGFTIENNGDGGALELQLAKAEQWLRGLLPGGSTGVG